MAQGFEELGAAEDYNAERLGDVFDYFGDNYIGRPAANGGRGAARYPIPTWDAFLRLDSGAPRTNNHAESWRQAFQGSLTCSHPTPFVLIEALREEGALQGTRYLGAMAGERTTKKRKNVSSEARIKTLVGDRENRSALDYLRGLPYNFVLG